MTTQRHAEQVGDALFQPYREKLDATKDGRQALRSTQQRRWQSPLLPAFVAAITTYVVLDYTLSALFAVMRGAALEGLVSWAARKSKAGRACSWRGRLHGSGAVAWFEVHLPLLPDGLPVLVPYGSRPGSRFVLAYPGTRAANSLAPAVHAHLEQIVWSEKPDGWVLLLFTGPLQAHLP
jgi:hypothetical protein